MKKELRVPPQSISSEEAVLGSIMLRKEGMEEVEDIVTPESFYVEKNKIIFQAMLDLHAKNEPIDMISLSTKLTEKKLIDSVGGNRYLAEMTQKVPSSTNIKHYAEIMQKKFVLRKLIEASDYVSELAFNEGDDKIEDILDIAEKKMFSVVASPSASKFVTLHDAIPEAMARLASMRNNDGKARGLETGFREFDKITSGLQKADLIILAARPSMGKTTLALDIARNAANKEKSVLVFSLEMSSQQLVDIMICAEAKVNAWAYRTGHLSDNDNAKVQYAAQKLANSKVYIDDEAGNSIVKMKAMARRIKAEKGLDLIVVDYLQLMSTSKKYDSMVNQVTEISRSLKSLAKELDVPVLALSQLSRAVEQRGGKPKLSDLRDSGSIEQDADLVMFIHREDKGKDEALKTNIAEILIEKHRNGPTGKIDLYFEEKSRTFINLEKGMSELDTLFPDEK